MNDRMTTDDVSPRDVINFPSFATKINSPSQPLLHDNDGVITAAATAAGNNYDGKENTGDEYNNPSPPSSTYKLLPPSSTMKSTKARRRIFDDDLDDKMVVVAEDKPRSSPPPRPQGLRTLGRANSFLQMFSYSSVSSDTIIEEETTSPMDKTNHNNNVDDFIRRPDYNGGERLINDINMDFAITHPSSPQRPIRNTHHRRYTPASPPTKDDDDKCGGSDSFSRFVSDFEIVGTLGNGSFGSVYSVRNRTDRRLYAIKAAKREARGSNDRDRMLQEVFALSSLSDKACISSMHIVRYHQAWMEGNRLYIQTELCDGTLLDEMQGGVVIDEQGRYKLLREILLALKLVHESGMIHLDIKPENIFRKSGMYKLGDFGLVSKIENHDDVEEGDSRYISLELLRGELDDLTKVRHHETHAYSNIQFNNKSHVITIIDTSNNEERHIFSRCNYV
jgi:tRNA A-37 threonylcarbamoyl transferase component Bud32